VFLDVGANEGQTTWRVLTYERIDRVHAFEPAPTCVDAMRGKYGNNPRVLVHPYGLWDKNCMATLRDEGSVGASVVPDFRNPQPNGRSAECRFVRASEWIHWNVSEGDWVVLKMNCEGCECDILDDLLDSGEWRKLAHVLCDFDVRKSPSQAYRRAETLRKIRRMGVENFHICEHRHRTYRILKQVLRQAPASRLS